MSREHWSDDAKCKGKPSSVFFPPFSYSDNRWLMAREICASCDVREQCLALVMRLEYTDDKWGMFGGLTPDERRDLRRQNV